MKTQATPVANVSRHTPEPWYASESTLGKRMLIWPNADRDCEAFSRGMIAQVDEPLDAARIVACVNALAGLNPEAVKDVVNLIERARSIIATMVTTHDGENVKIVARNILKESGVVLAKLKS